jgi:Helicase associated domain
VRMWDHSSPQKLRPPSGLFFLRGRKRGYLKIYREREGHCRVPHDHVEGQFRLGQWARANRDRLSKSPNLQGSLQDERRRRLEELGFAWNLVHATWEEGFNRLKTYREREGHCRVPRFHTEDTFRLGRWVASQRGRRETLSADHRSLLETVGFVWDPLDVAWDHAIECLKRFKERAGHCEVPIDFQVNGFRLGKWVSRQRQRRGKLSEQRRQQLNGLGFVWKVRRDARREAKQLGC